MLRWNWRVFLTLLLILATFDVISADGSSAADASSKETSSADDSSAKSASNQDDNSREKRSQEEIMFGNQQNKPNGLVDDLMSMSESMDDGDSESLMASDSGDSMAIGVPDKKSNATQDKDDKTEDTKPADKDEKRTARQEDPDETAVNDMLMGSGIPDWYSGAQIAPSANALQYLVNSPSFQSLPSDEFSNPLYDQEDLYRRKRQLLGHPLPLRKRSLRSSLGQMIQKRGIRLPRRSMRLKRQVDMEDLLSLLGNLDVSDRGRYFDEQVQLPSRYTTLGYPETSPPEFRYPYNPYLQHDSVFSQNEQDEDSSDNMDAIDSLMLMPPNSRYPEVGSDNSPFRSRGEENEAIQKWLARHTTPSVFTVSRRSGLYPVDYRYVPGYKKRSRFGAGNRFNNRMSDDEDQDAEYGKWGQMVQVPEAYASGEDVARLYALANLMAEGEDQQQQQQPKMRRST